MTPSIIFVQDMHAIVSYSSINDQKMPHKLLKHKKSFALRKIFTQPPKHVTITWVGTELPSQATKNIHRWYVPKQLLTNGTFNEVTSCKHHYIGLPTQKTENNTYIFDDNSSLDKTINDDLKTNGFQRDRPWVDRFSMYSKRACQHSCTKPAITNIDNIDASYGKSSNQTRHLATTTRLDY